MIFLLYYKRQSKNLVKNPVYFFKEIRYKETAFYTFQEKQDGRKI